MRARRLTASTDRDGRFQIDSVPPGRHEVTIRDLTYFSIVDTLAFPAAGTNGLAVRLRRMPQFEAEEADAREIARANATDWQPKLTFGVDWSGLECTGQEQPSMTIDGLDVVLSGCLTYGMPTGLRAAAFRLGRRVVLELMLAEHGFDEVGPTVIVHERWTARLQLSERAWYSLTVRLPGTSPGSPCPGPVTNFVVNLRSVARQ